MARKAQAPKLIPAVRSLPDDDALDTDLDLQDLDAELGGFISEAQSRGSRHLSSDEVVYG